jgi:phosphoglucosamine mutase
VNPKWKGIKMGRYFGTDGFRGEANKNLTVEHAYKVGRFIGWYYHQMTGKKCKVVIGKDTRRSSYMFEYSLVAGLTASGADAYLLHVTTTPSVSYVTRTEDFDCGIMISASHNPFYDNGIKLINGNGEKMDEKTISYIEDYIDGKLNLFGEEMTDIPFAVREEIGCTVDYAAGRNRYVGYLISLATYSYKNMRVGLDCANGSSWMIAKSVFDALGAKTYVINAEPDGTNINNHAGSTHIEVLQKFVKDNNLDVGFAYDGDADRCIAVDEKGNVVDGDLILYIYGKYMKERGKLLNNTVVTTIMSNFGLYKAFDEAGINYEKTAVGDKYVYENMVQNGHRIGGEQSGHIIFSKYATTGDGILTSMKMMEVILAKKLPLSKLAEPVTIYPQVLKNVRVKSKPEAQNDLDVQEAVAKVAEMLGDTGRILVRESGTEPVIRVMVEAETESLCEKYVDQVIDVIKSKGHIA